MTAALTVGDLQSLASAVYGPRWQSALARDLGVNIRTVQRWAAQGIDRPLTAENIRKILSAKSRIRINPPPAGDYSDRDDDAYDEIRPLVEAIVGQAADAGWHPAETVTALIAASVDIIRADTGDAAAVQILDQIRAAIKNGR